MRRTQRYQLVDALREAENALLDYVERLEQQGCVMGYGRAVIKKVQEALVVALESK
jgi:hypothetical protein